MIDIDDLLIVSLIDRMRHDDVTIHRHRTQISQIHDLLSSLIVLYDMDRSWLIEI